MGPAAPTSPLRKPVGSGVALARLSAVATLLALGVLALQVACGAYGSEFGQDEASHYVSGLMLHDYLVSGFAQSPLAYVRTYYGHYPLVGIGHWPPLFYVVEAAWMLVFSPERSSVLLLSGCVTWVAALTLYAGLTRRFGPAIAAVAAAILIATPIVQTGSSTLMLDMPTALACLAAMLIYARYLETGRMAVSAAFGGVALIAIMIKGNGAALALLPPCAVLIGRRFDLPRTRGFLLPLPIVGLLAAPWYWLTYGRAAAGFRYTWGIDYVLTSTQGNFGYLLESLGWPVLALAACGFIDAVIRPRRVDAMVLAAAALFAAVWLFQIVVPAALQNRYLAPAVAPLLILASHALAGIVERAAPGRRHAPLLAAVGLAVAFLLFVEARPVRKPHSGVMEAVSHILAHPVAGNPAVLIVGNPDEEVQGISEIAMHDTGRPNLFAIRGSRLLGGGGYNNQDYLPRFGTVAEVMAAIDAQAIPLALVGSGEHPGDWAHLGQVRAAVQAFPDRWRTAARFGAPGAEPLILYRIAGNDTQGADTARLLTLSAPRGL